MKRRQHQPASSLFAFALLALAACSPARPSSPTVPAPAAGDPGLRAETLRLVNAARGTARSCGSKGFAATRALTWNARLEAAALAHNRDMVQNDFFDHQSSDGSILRDRIDRAGYAWSMIGENLAAGQDTLEAAMRGWIKSPGHCANLMNPNFTEVGLSVLRGGDGNKYDWYWTMEFGKPR